VSKVTFLSSVGCTPCLRVKRYLNEFHAKNPQIEVEEIEFSSQVGSKLALENDVLYPPAVFLEGKLIAKGKIDAEKMIATIQENEMATI
jgi:alkyl hydroperoxide reductase subunit AhpF